MLYFVWYCYFNFKKIHFCLYKSKRFIIISIICIKYFVNKKIRIIWLIRTCKRNDYRGGITKKCLNRWLLWFNDDNDKKSELLSNKYEWYHSNQRFRQWLCRYIHTLQWIYSVGFLYNAGNEFIITEKFLN